MAAFNEAKKGISHENTVYIYSSVKQHLKENSTKVFMWTL